jgi:ATP-dependent Clp protease ATP-binding subunit ClpC
MVDEPSNQTTLEILEGLKKHFEDFHGVAIQTAALSSAIKLSKRYMLNRPLPDKAIDIIDEACARKSTMHEKLSHDDDYQHIEQQILALDKDLE